MTALPDPRIFARNEVKGDGLQVVLAKVSDGILEVGRRPLVTAQRFALGQKLGHAFAHDSVGDLWFDRQWNVSAESEGRSSALRIARGHRQRGQRLANRLQHS